MMAIHGRVHPGKTPAKIEGLSTGRAAKVTNTRKSASIVGVLFIIGTAAGILSAVLTAPIFAGPDVLANTTESETRLILGALMVLVMGLALAMIPVVLFQIFRKYSKTLAMGYVVFRGGLETFLYIAMVVSWLLLLTLSREFAASATPEASYFQHTGALLQTAGDQINGVLKIVFSLGALMFYTLWFQSRLIPRWLSGWGLAGALVYLGAGLAALFGFDLEYLTILLAVNEMVLALWLIIRGFNPAALRS